MVFGGLIYEEGVGVRLVNVLIVVGECFVEKEEGGGETGKRESWRLGVKVLVDWC